MSARSFITIIVASASLLVVTDISSAIDCGQATTGLVTVPDWHRATFFWLTAHEGDYPTGADCYDEQKIDMTTSIARFNQHYLDNTPDSPWDTIHHLEQFNSVEGNPDQAVTLDMVMDNLAGNGIIGFDTHGTVSHDIAIEPHEDRTSTENAIRAYVSSSEFSLSELALLSTDKGGPNEHWYVGLSPSGIAQHLKPLRDSDSFLSVIACQILEADGSSSFWDTSFFPLLPGAFLGSTNLESVGDGCVLLQEIFRRLSCQASPDEPRTLDLGHAACTDSYGSFGTYE